MKRRIAIGIAALGAVLAIAATTMFGLGISAASSYADNARSVVAEAAASPTAPQSPPPIPVPTPTATPGTPGTDANPFDIPASLSPEEEASATLWLQAYAIEKQCMADQGFEYRPIPPWGYNHDNRLQNWMSFVPADQFDAAWAAYYGHPGTGADYHWQDAGCHGYATHVMSNDDVH